MINSIQRNDTFSRSTTEVCAYVVHIIIYVHTYECTYYTTLNEYPYVLLHEVPTIHMLYPHCAKRRISATRKSTGQEKET